MHKLKRVQPPHEFIVSFANFVHKYPPADPSRTESTRWEAWKNECQEAYKAVVTCLHKNQYGLCAFCEIELTETNRQIEHFVPKSMTSQSRDWTINFSNYMLSCKGNENRYTPYYSDNPSEQENYTCGHKKDNIDPSVCICNPYELPEYPVVKEIYREDGLWFAPDTDACQRAGISPGLVETTLKLLGLNCPNLVRRRKAVWEELLKEIDKIFAEGSQEEHRQKLKILKENNLVPENNKLPSFYTTRFLCIKPELI